MVTSYSATALESPFPYTLLARSVHAATLDPISTATSFMCITLSCLRYCPHSAPDARASVGQRPARRLRLVHTHGPEKTSPVRRPAITSCSKRNHKLINVCL